MKGEYQEFIAPTVGFSSEVIKQDPYTIKVYDLGGGVNIRGIWPRYYSELHGAVFVVDSTDRTKLPAAREVLHQALEHPWFANKSVLVMANKQDKAEPMSSAEIASNLGLEKFKGLQSHVIVCSALMEEGSTPDPRITQGLKWLINAIDSNYATLQKRIYKDSEQQKEEERVEREEKRKRVEARKRERELERERQEKEEKEKGKMHTIAIDDANTDNTISVITEVPASSSHSTGTEQVVKSESRKNISKNAVVPTNEVLSSIDEMRKSKVGQTPRTPRNGSVYASTTIIVGQHPGEPAAASLNEEDTSRPSSSRAKSPDAFIVQVQTDEPNSSKSSLPPLSAISKYDITPSPSIALDPLPPLEKTAFV